MENTANLSTDDKISTLADTVEKLGQTVAQFFQSYAQGVTNALTGEQASTRRPGRPPGSKNKPKTRLDNTPTAATPARPATKELHPVAVEILNRVGKAGRISQSQLSKAMDQNRANVAYHVKPLIEQGKIISREVVKDGLINKIYYTPEWAKFRDI